MAERSWRGPGTILACGGLVLALSLGLRHGFGLFLQPISMASGWGREVFALAIAFQNLVWGAAQPFTGMLADRIGAGRVMLGGAVLYVAGLALMSYPQGATEFMLSAGLLIGLGLSGTTFPIVFGAVSRAMPPERRSFAMGVTMAVGSFGQFLMLPGTFGLMELFGWSGALVALSILCALVLPLSLAFFGRAEPKSATPAPAGLPAGAAFREALGHRGFWLLSLGFFVCGFQVVFIAVHLPAFLADKGLDMSVGTTVLALIGLVNVAGTYCAGLWGGRYSKPKLLVWIYLGRAVAIALFVFLPITTWTAYLFGVTMGLFWLSTVPLTNGFVAAVFGVKNMSMLAGIVFFAHQVGGFLGGWVGGYLYDRLGSYDVTWGLAIALSLVAAVLNAPIRETPVARLQPAGAGS